MARHVAEAVKTPLSEGARPLILRGADKTRRAVLAALSFALPGVSGFGGVYSG